MEIISETDEYAIIEERIPLEIFKEDLIIRAKVYKDTPPQDMEIIFIQYKDRKLT